MRAAIAVQMSSAAAPRKLPAAVRRHAEGDLQDSLRQAVGAERDADQRQVVAAPDARRVHREHRQDEEQAEHAQAEDSGKARAGAHLGRVHAFGGHGRVSAGKRNTL
jgi:hypothetical protein